MNQTIFKVCSTATDTQIAALFDNQLNNTLCTIYLIEQYQRTVAQDEHIQFDAANIETLTASLLNQIDLISHIYKGYEKFLKGFNTSLQAGQIQSVQILAVDPSSTSLNLHDFITLQLSMIKAAYCCFFDISECLGVAEHESYHLALKNTVSSVKNMLEQTKRAFQALKTIAIISIH